MTLGQFATAVGATPRWVQNARAVLKLHGRYSDDTARTLGLARELADATGMPLMRAFPLATSALAAWPAERQWTYANVDASVRMTIDLQRYLSAFSTRLSLARSAYQERRRGPRPARSRNPVAAATEYGWDVTLFDESFKLTPVQRLRRLDEMSEFFRRAHRVSEP